MASGRMLNNSFIQSNRFINLSKEAQALYIQCAGMADDDGFIDGIAAPARLAGVGETTIEELVEKDFLINFDTDVFVLTHWRINNHIKKDRYRQTRFEAEKDLLMIEENKPYTIRQECIQDGYIVDTQNSIGKLSRVESSKEELKKEESRVGELSKGEGPYLASTQEPKTLSCPTCGSKNTTSQSSDKAMCNDCRYKWGIW